MFDKARGETLFIDEMLQVLKPWIISHDKDKIIHNMNHRQAVINELLDDVE
jgi:hypothetical protein